MFRLMLLLLALSVAFGGVQALFPGAATEAAAFEAPPAEESGEAEIPECPPRFTRDYRPVCATNGRVYANRSIFEYHRCRAALLHGRSLELQDMAACGSRNPEL